MKRVYCFILVLILAISLVGCNSSSIGEAGIIGYVMNKENDRILVISQKAQDFSSNGGTTEYYDAIWFSKAPKEVKMGDKVKVWYDMVAESYPGQSEAIKVEFVQSQKPTTANLSESEALYKTLISEEIKAYGLIVMKSIEYDKQADRWNVVLKEIWSEKIVNMQVEDV